MILKACCHTLYKDCTWSFKEGRFVKLSLHIHSVLLSREQSDHCRIDVELLAEGRLGVTVYS
jgi:hypothetical protein